MKKMRVEVNYANAILPRLGKRLPENGMKLWLEMISPRHALALLIILVLLFRMQGADLDLNYIYIYICIIYIKIVYITIV